MPIDPTTTGEVTTALFNKLDLIIGAIVALLGKFGWDRAKFNHKKLPIDGSTDVELSSQITPRDSVMIWLTDRVHKVRNDLDASVLKNATGIEELKLRVTFLENDAKDFKTSTSASISRIHDHIDNRCDRLENLIEKLRDKE